MGQQAKAAGAPALLLATSTAWDSCAISAGCVEM
jgi:hypothetical protein